MVPNIYSNDEIVRTLRRLQRRGFTSAVIGGGAVRDLYFNGMPRDVDIFIHDPEHSTDFGDAVPKLDKHFWANQFNIKKPFRLNGSSDSVSELDVGIYADPVITQMWQVLKNYLPYQLVLLDMDPIEYVTQRFDIGLCMAYCDGKKFRFTGPFMTDAKNHTMTICGDGMTEPRMFNTLRKHIPRIKDKFPGYRVQVTPKNQEVFDHVRTHHSVPTI